MVGCLPVSRLWGGWASPRRGGTLTVALRSDIKTFLPLAAMDEPTRTVLGLCHCGLVRTNGRSHRLEGLLAENWQMRDAGRRITIRLREGLRFSDARPVTSQDVEFTVRAHLDERTASPQRDALIVGGRPVEVRVLDARNMEFRLAAPTALAERFLDELAILPKHVLGDRLAEGRLASAWGIDTRPSHLVASGPFRVANYQPGREVTLERNPHFWKRGAGGIRLPYLDRVRFVFTAGEDAQLARLVARECDVVLNVGAGNTALVERYAQERSLELLDLGAGLDAVYLLFNLDGQRERVSPWLGDARLRAAVAGMVDRASIARLVYAKRAVPMGAYASPGRGIWSNSRIPVQGADVNRWRNVLRTSGYRWDAGGALQTAQGTVIRMTLVVNSANPAYGQIAAIVAADLKRLGVVVTVAPLEFRSFVDRVMKQRDFDLAVMPLRSSNADPMADMNVLMSSGSLHLWNLGPGAQRTAWEQEIDRLMQAQAEKTDTATRKKLFDRVQEILAEQTPLTPLVSPHTIVAVRKGLANFQPSVLSNAALWNAEEIFWTESVASR